MTFTITSHPDETYAEQKNGADDEMLSFAAVHRRVDFEHPLGRQLAPIIGPHFAFSLSLAFGIN
jgi:hypothetical protein